MSTALEAAIAYNLDPPRVHMNGTSRDELVAGYMAALTALQEAQRALQATHPNGRDYYVICRDAFGRAQRQHASRVQRLNAITTEIGMLILAVQE